MSVMTPVGTRVYGFPSYGEWVRSLCQILGPATTMGPGAQHTVQGAHIHPLPWHQPNIHTMPNHVACELIVEGEAKEQDAFWGRADTSQAEGEEEGQEFSFAGHVPPPTDGSRDMGFLGMFFYSWHVSHWGTKWDAYEVEKDWEAGRDVNKVRFQTAWGAPTPWLAVVRAAHPDLRFTLWYADEDWGRNWGRIDPNGVDLDDMDVDEADMRRRFPDHAPPEEEDEEDDDPTFVPDAEKRPE